MKQTILFIFCLGLCAGLGFGKLKATTREADQKFSDQVNLALRQVGHQLLKLAGDERSTIPPVQINLNEVIKRDTLIAEIWGDEGVMVGRSLDVFISRLRKLLKGDKSVMIKNIHGVGYRLEVTN